MLRWFQILTPKEGRLFGLFEAHVGTLLAGPLVVSRRIADSIVWARVFTMPMAGLMGAGVNFPARPADRIF